MGIRRGLVGLFAGALTAATAVATPAVAAPSCKPAATATTCSVTLGPAPLGAPGRNTMLRFTVPNGVNRIDAGFVAGQPGKIGLGLFDQRGSGFQSAGFRGIAGEERKAVFVANRDATPGFIAGSIRRGTWTAVVANFFPFIPSFDKVRVVIRLTFGRTVPTPALQPVPELVKQGPGWYRGDLHVHTSFSSDADSSGKALGPAAMARRAQARGLDFINVSDHNVTAQNDRLRDAAPVNFLLLGGEEVTTWLGGPGHMTAAGLQSGDWLDWRFRPVLGRYANRASWTADDRPIQDAIAKGRSYGAYLAANHPFVAPGFGSDWSFFEDSDADIAALPDGLEVWNDDFWLTFSFAAIGRWDQELARGRHLCGSTGSDVHGVGGKTDVGTPTTVVYAPELSRAAIVRSMKECRMFVTDRPTGVAVTLTAATPDGEAMMGSTVTAPAGTTVPVTAHVQGGDGKWVAFIQNGQVIWFEQIRGNDAAITRTIGVGGGGAIRAQVHDFPLNLKPRALTNPIFLRHGAQALIW